MKDRVNKRQRRKQIATLFMVENIKLLTFVICGHFCCSQNKQLKEGENMVFSYC